MQPALDRPCIDSGILAGVADTGPTHVGLEQLGLWQALVPYGSESRDRPVSQAFKEFNGLMNAFDALSTQARLGAQGGDDWVEIRRALQKDDLPRFLSRSLPGLGGKSGETRMIHFSGLWDSQRHFQLTLASLSLRSKAPMRSLRTG